jgi:hypothetical protein
MSSCTGASAPAPAPTPAPAPAADVTLTDAVLATTGAKLGVAWNVGNSIVAFPSKRSTTAAVRADLSVSLHMVSWETTLYSPIMRKLVNESAQAFMALQKMAKEVDGRAEPRNACDAQ